MLFEAFSEKATTHAGPCFLPHAPASLPVLCLKEYLGNLLTAQKVFLNPCKRKREESLTFTSERNQELPFQPLPNPSQTPLKRRKDKHLSPAFILIIAADLAPSPPAASFQNATVQPRARFGSAKKIFPWPHHELWLCGSGEPTLMPCKGTRCFGKQGWNMPSLPAQRIFQQPLSRGSSQGGRVW